MLICTAAVSIFDCLNPPPYEATAKLYILDINQPDTTVLDLELGTLLMPDYCEIFKTWEVHENVKAMLGLDLSYSEMQNMLTIQSPAASRLLYITVRHPDAAFAAKLANAYAQAGHAFIAQTLHGLEPAVFSSAVIPSKTVGMGRLARLLLSAAAGLFLGIGLFVLLFCLDDRIRTTDDLFLASNLPVFASVFAGRRKHSPPAKNAFHSMSARLVSQSTGCVLLMPYSSASDACFVCQNLLETLTMMHRKAVWFHAECVDRQRDASCGAKLTDYLEGRCSWKDLLHPFGSAFRISVCAREEELLAQLFHPKTAALIEKLCNAWDTVLIDVPPSDQSAAGAAFYNGCSAALLVVRSGTASIREMTPFIASLTETGCPLAGTVLISDSSAKRKTAGRARRCKGIAV